ncbi:MAG: ABC transporter permease, partial [Acidimicrobiales bacterium]
GGFGGPDLLAEINDWDIPVLSNIADFSHGLFADVTWFTGLAYALVPAITWMLWRTRFGLRLRSCGEHPTAADSLGIDVYFYKYAAVMMSGGLAGVGGAYIAIEQSNIYKEGQVVGRGFIGLATVIFGNWRPAGTALGAALFGYIDALKLIDIEGSAIHAFLLVIVLCLSGVVVWAVTRKSKVDAVLAGVMATAFLTWYVLSDSIPSPFVKVAPYVIVLLVLVFASQRLRMPKADGLPWRKGDH